MFAFNSFSQDSPIIPYLPPPAQNKFIISFLDGGTRLYDIANYQFFSRFSNHPLQGPTSPLPVADPSCLAHIIRPALPR